MNLNVTDIDTVTPLWWPNYSIGILFGVLGLVGAAITVYFGGWEKLMGKSVRLLECEEEINSKKRIAEKLNEENDCDKRKVWEEIIDMEERRLSEERIFTRNLGVLLFILIGGVLASIIANTMLQAIIVGAGWIGVIGTYGLKKDNDMRREIRNKKDDELLEEWIEKTKELIKEALKEPTIIPEDLKTNMEKAFAQLKEKSSRNRIY